MTFTRVQKKAALDRIIDIVWHDNGSDPKSDIQMFIKHNGWTQPMDIWRFGYDHLDTLRFHDSSDKKRNTELKLSKHIIHKMKDFIWYIEVEMTNGKTFNEAEDFDSITEESFDSFVKPEMGSGRPFNS